MLLVERKSNRTKNKKCNTNRIEHYKISIAVEVIVSDDICYKNVVTLEWKFHIAIARKYFQSEKSNNKYLNSKQNKKWSNNLFFKYIVT